MNILKSSHQRLLALFIGITLSAVSVTPVAAGNLEAFSSKYKVSIKGREAGTASVTLNPGADGRWKLETVVTPNSVAQMLGAEESVDTIEFKAQKNSWTVTDYRQERRGRKAGITEVRQNGNKQYVMNLDGKKITEIPETIIEPRTFPIATLVLDQSQLTNRDVLLIRRDGFRAFQYQLDGTDEVEVSGKAFKTQRWKRVEKNNPQNWYWVWMSADRIYPVKIQRSKKGSLTTMELML